MVTSSTYPLSYLTAAGPAARPVLLLNWGLITISSIVILIVAALIIGAIFRHRTQSEETDAPMSEGGATSWITIGVGISIVPLFASMVWMLLVLRSLREPDDPTMLRIDVTAQMFWWSFHYDDDPSGPAPLKGFTTANEIHIPVGRPVHLRVTSADVIHSFWVPKLVGRMDMIPGQINETWLQADRPGLYRGQCGEFCGLEHAGMGFDVIAETPDDYLAWRRHQLEAPDQTPALQSAMSLFDKNCGSCHAVRGTMAAAPIAPDLSHVASRLRIGSGVLANTEASLRLWLKDPDAVKPGTSMPRPALSEDTLSAIISYVDSLK